MTRRRKPFAMVQRWEQGWYAIGAGGQMSSGPWNTEDEAREAAGKWNAAVDGSGLR